MLLERAEMIVAEGAEGDFAEAMRERGIPLLSSVEGVKSVQFGRGVESPTKFMLLVEWETMNAHVAFIRSRIFPTFRGVVGAFAKDGSMEHFEMD